MSAKSDRPRTQQASPALTKEAKAADQALTDLVRAVATQEGHPPGKPLPEGVELRWQPGLSEAAWVDQVRECVRVSMAHASPITRGRVFCYHCNASDCRHAAPDGPSEVFADFQSTGRPRFEPLLSYLLELGDDRVDQLVSASPSVVARVVGRRRLLGEQLPEYGRGSLKYAIWGQVVMGYIVLDGDKYALTFQVVEGGDRRIRPQILGSEQLLDAMADGHQARLAALMTVLRQSARKIENLALEAQTQTGKQARSELREKVFRVLRQLAISLERKGRQRGRRTKHAEHRRQERRPVASGFQALFRAPVESFYSDEVKGSLVVVGPSGRVHIYSEDGRHVTSLNLKKAEIERRLKRKRYLPLTPERVRSLRGAVEKRQAELGSDGSQDDGTVALR